MVRVSDVLFAAPNVDAIREVLYTGNVRHCVGGYVRKEDIVPTRISLDKERLQHNVMPADLAGKVIADDSDIAVVASQLNAIGRFMGIQLRVGVVTDSVALNADV